MGLHVQVCDLLIIPFPNNKFYSSKLEKFVDDNFKIDENGRKFSKPVENTVGKGEIARYEQFLLFPQCFQKTFNAGLVWEWVNSNSLSLVSDVYGLLLKNI